jgi:hypothetical protein
MRNNLKHGRSFMRHSGNRRNFVAIIVMALLLAVAMPATSFGKDRGRGNGRGRHSSHWKCGKFVNCHDARDGRRDGRGRRRWNDDRSGRRRWRQWDRDNNNWVFHNRNRNRNRDYDRDNLWRNRQRRISRIN